MQEEKKPVDLTKLKEPFPEKDIEWRVSHGGIKDNGETWAMVLAYVDARAVQNRLDDVVGMENWKTSYQHLPGGTMCTLSIKVNGEWVDKCDGSPETELEAFKGGISKALVRAASSWGIGRYLYGLEANFANIHKNRVDGSMYSQIKDKKSGKAVWVYWTPPRLPDWAIPAIQRKENLPPSNEQKPAEPPATPPVKPREPDAKPPVQKTGGITDKQRKMLWARLMKLEYSETEAKEFLAAHSGKASSTEWTRAEFDKVLKAIEFLEKSNPQHGDAYEGP